MISEISERDIYNRLILMNDIIKQYIEKYDIKEDEYTLSFEPLKNIKNAEWIHIDFGNKKINWGHYTDKKEHHHYDPVVAARLNTGEIQGYWGYSTYEHGHFEVEDGYYYYTNSEFIVRINCSDSDIKDYVKEKFLDFIRYQQHYYTNEIKWKEESLQKIQERVDYLKGRYEHFKITRI